MESAPYNVSFSAASIALSLLHLSLSIKDRFVYTKIASGLALVAIHALNITCQIFTIINFSNGGGDLTSALRFGACRLLILVTGLVGISIAEEFNVLLKKITRIGFFKLARMILVLIFATFLMASLFLAGRVILDIFTFTTIFTLVLITIWLKANFKIPKLKHSFPTSPQPHQSLLADTNLAISKKTQMVLQQYGTYQLYLNFLLVANIFSLVFVVLVLFGYTSSTYSSISILGEAIAVISSVILLEVYKTLPYEINVTVRDQMTLKDETKKRWSMPLSKAPPVNESSDSQNRWTLPPNINDDNRSSRLMSPTSPETNQPSVVSQNRWTLPASSLDIVVERSSKMVVPKRSSFLPSARNSMAPARNSMTPARNSMIPSRSSGIIKTKFDNTPLSPTTKAISAETKSKLVVAAVAEENAVEVSDQAAKGSVVPQEPPPVVVSDHIPLPEDHTDQPPVIVSDHIPVSENHTGPEPATAAPAITDPKPESDNLVSKKTGHRPVSSTMANSFLPTSHSLENLFTIVSQFESWDHIYPEADAQSIVVAEEEEEEYLEAPGVVEEQVASVLPDGLENPHNAEDIKEVETQDVVVEKDVITQQEDVAVADLKPDEEIPRLAANPVIKSEESHRGDLKE